MQEHPKEAAFYRLNLPLDSIHPYAHPAAIAAECAAKLGSTLVFQAALFRESPKAKIDWAEWALRHGVSDPPAFKECLDSRYPLQVIAADVDRASRLGFSGTPTFVINGKVFAAK